MLGIVMFLLALVGFFVVLRHFGFIGQPSNAGMV